MPISAPPTRKAGFTRIEMLVVLTIIGLVAAAAAVRLGGPPAGAARQRAVQTLRVAFAKARSEASATGRAAAVRPAALVAEAALATPAFPAPPGEILFYPDGSSSAGTVSLRGAPVLEIDWLTGEARDAG
ncbi:MAG TPA: type II secretion system protein [Allosphingosinicella sp.]|jgi:general secretion pathway protein H